MSIPIEKLGPDRSRYMPSVADVFNGIEATPYRPNETTAPTPNTHTGISNPNVAPVVELLRAAEPPALATPGIFDIYNKLIKQIDLDTFELGDGPRSQATTRRIGNFMRKNGLLSLLNPLTTPSTQVEATSPNLLAPNESTAKTQLLLSLAIAQYRHAPHAITDNNDEIFRAMVEANSMCLATEPWPGLPILPMRTYKIVLNACHATGVNPNWLEIETSFACKFGQYPGHDPIRLLPRVLGGFVMDTLVPIENRHHQFTSYMIKFLADLNARDLLVLDDIYSDKAIRFLARYGSDEQLGLMAFAGARYIFNRDRLDLDSKPGNKLLVQRLVYLSKLYLDSKTCHDLGIEDLDLQLGPTPKQILPLYRNDIFHVPLGDYK